MASILSINGGVPITPALTDVILGADDPAGTPADALFTPAGILSLAGITMANGTQGVAGPSLTAAQAFGTLDLTQTWNTTGTPTAIKLNVTDTASNAASLLLDLQVAGASRATITKLGQIRLGDGSNTAPGISFVGRTGMGFYRSTSVMVYSDASADIWWTGVSNIVMRNNGSFAFSSGTVGGGTADVSLYRDAAAALALRGVTGTNAQTFRVYHTYTDVSNYQRLTLSTAAAYVQLAAETAGTGADDLDVLLTPAGTGTVRFGVHATSADVAVSGYITIKDAAGTSRKLAVIT